MYLVAAPTSRILLDSLMPGTWNMFLLNPAKEHYITMNVDIDMFMKPASGNLFLVFYEFSLVCW